MIRALLMLMLSQTPSCADVPWLVPQSNGPTAVEVKQGTVTVSGLTQVAAEGVYSLISADISGDGFAVFNATGTLKNCAIVPPSDNSRYDFEILLVEGTDEFPVFGRENIKGKAGLIGTRAVMGGHKMQFSNTTEEGWYKARCVVQK